MDIVHIQVLVQKTRRVLVIINIVKAFGWKYWKILVFFMVVYTDVMIILFHNL